MTTKTKTTKTRPETPKKAEPSRTRIFLGLTIASATLAILAGRRGAPVLGETLGETIAKATAPSRRHTKDLFGLPRGTGELPAAPVLEDPSDAAFAPLATRPPVLLPGPRARAARSEAPADPPRTRGVYVPASVVLAYAKRGKIPAVDGPDGIVLRGVLPGTGLLDGDRLVRVGRAPVRSVGDVTGIVSSALLAGHTHLSGTVRRGDEEIDVTVEIPTGEADAGAPPP